MISGERWRRLWTGYLTFYKATVPEEVYATTWKRLFDPGEFEPRDPGRGKDEHSTVGARCGQ